MRLAQHEHALLFSLLFTTAKRIVDLVTAATPTMPALRNAPQKAGQNQTAKIVLGAEAWADASRNLCRFFLFCATLRVRAVCTGPKEIEPWQITET